MIYYASFCIYFDNRFWKVNSKIWYFAKYLISLSCFFFQTTVIFKKEKFENNKYGKIKNIVKLEITAIIQGNMEVIRITYVN